MYIGIDVGGSHIRTGLLDEKFNIVEYNDIYINKEIPADNIKDKLIQSINNVINEEDFSKIFKINKQNIKAIINH